jgi:translation initiation factor 3 subunit G
VPSSFQPFQITRRIKRTLQKSVVEHTVAERQKWAKFGKERGNKPGPDRATTTVGENVALKLSAGNKACPLQYLNLPTHTIII